MALFRNPYTLKGYTHGQRATTSFVQRYPTRRTGKVIPHCKYSVTEVPQPCCACAVGCRQLTPGSGYTGFVPARRLGKGLGLGAEMPGNSCWHWSYCLNGKQQSLLLNHSFFHLITTICMSKTCFHYLMAKISHSITTFLFSIICRVYISYF